MLKPIEYDKVDIGTISVEIKHAGKIFDGTRKDIKELLGNNGYAFVTSVHIDDIFTKKKVSNMHFKTIIRIVLIVFEVLSENF